MAEQVVMHCRLADRESPHHIGVANASEVKERHATITPRPVSILCSKPNTSDNLLQYVPPANTNNDIKMNMYTVCYIINNQETKTKHLLVVVVVYSRSSSSSS